MEEVWEMKKTQPSVYVRVLFRARSPRHTQTRQRGCKHRNVQGNSHTHGCLMFIFNIVFCQRCSFVWQSLLHAALE